VLCCFFGFFPQRRAVEQAAREESPAPPQERERPVGDKAGGRVALAPYGGR
jgi:hypothetical protein